MKTNEIRIQDTLLVFNTCGARLTLINKTLSLKSCSHFELIRSYYSKLQI